MPNSLRISNLTESSRLLEEKIEALESKPGASLTSSDIITLKEMWAQRTLFQYELSRLIAAQKANVSAFFGGKI